MYIGQERQWKDNNKHFIILSLSLDNENSMIEYLDNNKIQIQTMSNYEIEQYSVIVEKSSFLNKNCLYVSQFESGKEWLYNNRCRTCQHRLKCSYL